MSTPKKNKQPKEPKADKDTDKPSPAKRQKKNTKSKTKSDADAATDLEMEDGKCLLITTPEYSEALAYEVPVRFYNQHIRPLVSKCKKEMTWEAVSEFVDEFVALLDEYPNYIKNVHFDHFTSLKADEYYNIICLPVYVS